jgi:hypothetical protein
MMKSEISFLGRALPSFTDSDPGAEVWTFAVTGRQSNVQKFGSGTVWLETGEGTQLQSQTVTVTIVRFEQSAFVS